MMVARTRDDAKMSATAAPVLDTPEKRMAPLETPETPTALEGFCVRCGTHSADVFDGEAGPFCGSGCVEMTRRGL